MSTIFFTLQKIKVESSRFSSVHTVQCASSSFAFAEKFLRMPFLLGSSGVDDSCLGKPWARIVLSMDLVIAFLATDKLSGDIVMSFRRPRII